MGYRVSGTFLMRNGRAVIPVMAEAHYSRIPRPLWPMVIGQLRAAGVTIVSSYVFWNHHQPSAKRRPDFSGQLDLSAFIAMVHDHGMDFGLRIGPWVHGESRHGGLPDWVACGPWRTRTNDPQYLALVDEWFHELGAQIAGSELAVLQVENELYGEPNHLLTLKQLAARAGIRAALNTATAWGGAQFERSEFLPVYGGYPDTFWSAHSLGWEQRCEIHYHFQPIRDDALIGEDGRSGIRPQIVDDSKLPYATCELGAGMTTSYHRRPTIQGRDVGALGITKIGCGSVWQGWYMMAGGTNPIADGQPLHESVQHGAPNELPWRDYDFSAPIGSAGQLRESAHLLRAQHAMLALLGPQLAGSRIALHDDAPVRHAIRTWESDIGETALVLVNHHQPHTEFTSVGDFQIEVAPGRYVPPLPAAINNGEFGAWVANLELADGVVLTSSDVMPIAKLDGRAQTCVFLQTLSQGATCSLRTTAGPRLIESELREGIEIFPVTGGKDDVRVILVPLSEAATVWPLRGRCLISAAPLSCAPDGIEALCTPEVSGAKIREITPDGIETIACCPELTETRLPLIGAPSGAGGVWKDSLMGSICLPPAAGPTDRVKINWAGNIIRLVRPGGDPEHVGDVLVDQFWHGAGEMVTTVSHLAGERTIDIYLQGFAPDEQIVENQPHDRAVISVTLLPVRKLRLAE